MMKRTIVATCIVMLFSGCRKNDTFSNTPDVIINGHVVESCTDSTPVSGLSIYVIGDHSTDFCEASWEDIGAVTDENGNFTIRYDAKDFCSLGAKSLGYRINFGTPKTMISGLPTKVEKETTYNLTLYKKAFTNYAVIIRTSKSYSERDTLWWREGVNRDLVYLTGPFTDGTVIKSFSAGSSIPLHQDKPSAKNLFVYTFMINGEHTKEQRPVSLTSYSCGQINEIPVELPD